jgi:hypothetical protein
LGKYKLEGERQALQAAEGDGIAPEGVVILKTQMGRATEEGFDRYLTFKSCQWGSQTVVHAHTEGEMRLLGTGNVQSIRIGECFRVVVA